MIANLESVYCTLVYYLLQSGGQFHWRIVEPALWHWNRFLKVQDFTL